MVISQNIFFVYIFPVTRNGFYYSLWHHKASKIVAEAATGSSVPSDAAPHPKLHLPRANISQCEGSLLGVKAAALFCQEKISMDSCGEGQRGVGIGGVL